MLSQLNLSFDREKVFEWSEGDAKKAYKGRKRYDFYLPASNTIIEVHGAQHYEKGFEAIGGRTLKEEQKNDEQNMYGLTRQRKPSKRQDSKIL